MIRVVFTGICITSLLTACSPSRIGGARRKDIEMVTTKGTIVLRLSDSTPLHRDNFLRLVKTHFYDSVLFHRVIKNFMIQAGDPVSRRATDSTDLGDHDTTYKIPAEIRPGLFHRKGALAAARESDNVNPTKASSGTQWYIVEGRRFTDAGLDSMERGRLKGRKIPAGQREVYRSVGGAPHLDRSYTVFGEVVRGLDVVDSIASVPTSGRPFDRPLEPVRILKMRLIRRTDRSVK
ncbi:MAG: peptidylprolyl isomerase [Bacteroidetes bacterium]|nr:peptidylprolyl isomerase [Bacteroidota bacterium]